MSQPLETILRLQHALNDLRRAEKQLAGVPEWMEELHAEHSARQAEIAAVQEEAAEAARERRHAESAAQDAGERLKHFQRQVSLVRTQREYAALLQEIDTVKSQIKALEEAALGAMERADGAQRRLEEQQGGSADLESRYGEALSRWEREKPDVERQAAAQRAEVAELRQQLPRGTVALFDRVHQRRGDSAVAPVRRSEGSGSIWHCTACNYSVRLQVVADIRSRGILVQCEGCRRFLYVEEDAG
ncbi:MAG TPA: hypothetical protein VMT16_07825 [Thermoanaerobaculia bacterium]|nr:hypothetical protein [Thermoanaerobaculia bacterium]